MKSKKTIIWLAGFAVLSLLWAAPTLAKGDKVCEQLKTGVLVDVFGAEAETATFQSGSRFVPQPLCTAVWNKPDYEELSAASSQYIMEKAMAKAMKKDFNEVEPPPPGYTVSLTLIDQVFETPEAAIASLESAVAQLTEGITISVQGKDHTTQVEFDDWLEGVGDKAIWAPKLSELQVANAGKRFAISVKGFSNPEQNFAKAVELANRISASDLD